MLSYDDPPDDDEDVPVDEEQLEIEEWEKLYPEEFA
jgi:hypothetical protein